MTPRRCACACVYVCSPHAVFTRVPAAPGLLFVFQRKTSRRVCGCCLHSGPESGLCPLLEHSSSSSPCRLSCLRQLVRMLPALGMGLCLPCVGRAALRGGELPCVVESTRAWGQVSSGNGDTAMGGTRAGRPRGCGGLQPQGP